MRTKISDADTNYLRFIANDDKAARKVYRTVEQALATGRGALLSYVANEFADQPDMIDAIEAYDDRVGDQLEEYLKPELDGRTLTFTSKGSKQFSNIAVAGTLVGMLLPAVQQVREAARRTQSMNNLRQIALSSLNYESAHMHFPQKHCGRRWDAAFELAC